MTLPGVSPLTVVRDWIVVGACVHVLPPSRLHCHSYDARWPAALATNCTVPEVLPAFTTKVVLVRAGVFFEAIPALAMMLGALSGSASAAVWTSAMNA